MKRKQKNGRPIDLFSGCKLSQQKKSERNYRKIESQIHGVPSSSIETEEAIVNGKQRASKRTIVGGKSGLSARAIHYRVIFRRGSEDTAQIAFIAESLI